MKKLIVIAIVLFFVLAATAIAGNNEAYGGSTNEAYGKRSTSPNIIVAASDSTAKAKDAADFVCPGTDDDVQIQVAIDALTAYGTSAAGDGRGIVHLTEGNFYIGSTISMRSGVTLEGSGINASNLLYRGRDDGSCIDYVGGGLGFFMQIRDLGVWGESTFYNIVDVTANTIEISLSAASADVWFTDKGFTKVEIQGSQTALGDPTTANNGEYTIESIAGTTTAILTVTETVPNTDGVGGYGTTEGVLRMGNLSGSGIDFRDNDAKDNKITRVWVSSFPDYGMYIGNAWNQQITNCTIEFCRVGLRGGSELIGSHIKYCEWGIWVQSDFRAFASRIVQSRNGHIYSTGDNSELVGCYMDEAWSLLDRGGTAYTADATYSQQGPKPAIYIVSSMDFNIMDCILRESSGGGAIYNFKVVDTGDDPSGIISNNFIDGPTPLFYTTGLFNFNFIGNNCASGDVGGSDHRVVTRKNTTGSGSLVAGDVVIAKYTATLGSELEVASTTSGGDDAVFGMALATIANNASGPICTEGFVTNLRANGNTNIAIGNFLTTHTAAGIAVKAGAGDMAFAIALEVHEVDSTVAIDALLITPRKL